MHNQNIILSICIPTYNRAEFLNSSLRSIFKQIENNSLVEVVVSDNDSTDDTFEVVKSYRQYTNFKYFRQGENVGMSKNILDVVSKAQGEFCWLIGDDDFILQGAIDQLLKLIHTNKEVDFYYVKLGGININEYRGYKEVFDSTYCMPISEPVEYELIDKWEKLVGPKYSSIFMGELMASIFRKKIWLTYKVYPDNGFLSNIENSYVFTVVYANTFYGRKSMYIYTPMILVLDGVRDWWDRLGYILIVLGKELLDLHKEKGLENPTLRECNIAYIEMTLPFVFKYSFFKSKFKDKISIKKYVWFLCSHPFLTILALLIMLRKLFTKVFNKALKYLVPSIHQQLKQAVSYKLKKKLFR